MSYDMQEAMYEAAMDELYDELAPQAVEEFRQDRLQSYYRNHPELAVPAFRFLERGREHLGSDPTATTLYCAIGAESIIKNALLKPLVYGLVHREDFASLITNLALRYTSLDRYKQLLFEVLGEHGGVDPRTFQRQEDGPTLWQEVQEIRSRRNDIAHNAQPADEEDAELAVGVTATLVEQIFPRVISRVGFHVHDDYVVCTDRKCLMEERLKRMRGRRGDKS